MKIKKLLYPKAICLNINNSCCLNCWWCYKKDVICDELDYEKYKKFYYSIICDHISTVSLIGGEPTEHRDFLKIVKLIKGKNILLNTNVLAFSDIELLKECIVNTYSKQSLWLTIALKGYSSKSYYDTTGSKTGFNRLCKAIDNIKKEGIPHTLTYVYDHELSDLEINLFYYFLLEKRIETIVISDLRVYIEKGQLIKPEYNINNYEKAISWFLSKGINVYARVNRPLCLYNKKFIQGLLDRGKLITSCAVKKRNGFFISSQLEVIACNQLDSYKLGVFEQNFNSYEEMCRIWNSDNIINYFDILAGYPMKKCITCNWWKICGGGCVLNWKKGGDNYEI